MDEHVDTFAMITGATPDIARRYLGMTDNNTEQAIQLFFDSPDLASSVSQAPQASAPPIPTATHPQRSTSDSLGEGQHVVHVGSDDDDMDIDDDQQAASAAQEAARAADFEDDEAYARRMQEEMYAGGDGGFDADRVRAPMARTTETLVGGAGGDWGHDDMNAAVFAEMRARQQARAAAAGTGGRLLKNPSHLKR